MQQQQASYFIWMVGSSTGGIAGSLLGADLGWQMSEQTAMGLLLVGLKHLTSGLFGSLLGALVGTSLAQSLLLWRANWQTRWWLVGSIGGGLVGFGLVSRVHQSFGYVLVLIPVVTIWLVQARVLRTHIRRANLWVAATVLGAIISGAATVIAQINVEPLIAQGGGVNLLVAILPGLLYGAVTGATLVWLLQQQPEQDTNNR
jgi:hypothetical protein